MELKDLAIELEKLGADIKKEAKKALNKEADIVIKKCKENTPVASSLMRKSWFKTPVKIKKDNMEVIVGNSAEYASYIEKGFRAHFVPGEWQGSVFSYDRNAKGGMMVTGKNNPSGPVKPGEYIPGYHMLENATEKSEERLRKDMEQRLNKLAREFNVK